MDDFICISCWKEFSAPHEHIVANQGKIECPNCGHIFRVDLGEAGEDGKAPVLKLPSVDTGTDSVSSKELDWSELDSIKGLSDSPGLFAEADAASIEPPESTSDEIDFTAEEADEKTPVEPMNHGEFVDSEATEELEDEPIEWRLRTKSGLTFRFSDPEALLGWKKKMSVYKEMQVSWDGQRWVDYLLFVEQYETSGDAQQAFSITNGDPIVSKPNKPKKDGAEAKPDQKKTEETQKVDEANLRRRLHNKRPTEEFTFRTADSSETAWGKNILLIIVGLALGSGAVWLAWSFIF
jgi:DNA-directed RNA polymerase subunit RPC12/RpoP